MKFTTVQVFSLNTASFDPNKEFLKRNKQWINYGTLPTSYCKLPFLLFFSFSNDSGNQHTHTDAEVLGWDTIEKLFYKLTNPAPILQITPVF
jgi:hypothetical protein